MASDTHNRTKHLQKSEDDEELDHVEVMLKKAGCLELHYKVQECMFDTRDWRQCQSQVQDFKKCIEASKQKDHSLKS